MHPAHTAHRTSTSSQHTYSTHGRVDSEFSSLTVGLFYVPSQGAGVLILTAPLLVSAAASGDQPSVLQRIIGADLPGSEPCPIEFRLIEGHEGEPWSCTIKIR